MPIGSINQSNSSVSFGKKHHVSNKTKHVIAYTTLGVATAGVTTAAIIKRKSIGDFFKVFKNAFKEGMKEISKKSADVNANVKTEKAENSAKKTFGTKIKDFFSNMGTKIKNLFSRNKKQVKNEATPAATAAPATTEKGENVVAEATQAAE